jgi:exopolyphosphatase/guanosine-5'-triphosphate,3'-diphosphate pyrophosphatase
MRYATIDVGTNSVLLLVAEKTREGKWTPVRERAEITRLGRGVDKTRTLHPEAIAETLATIKTFTEEARTLGAKQIAATATSAARDATNGQDFITRTREEAGIELEILSGDLEAQLSYAAVQSDFGANGRPLVAIDIGGGSTEFIYGQGPQLTYRRSFDVGSVRLTERMVEGDRLTPEERQAIESFLKKTFAELPRPPEGFEAVAVAGTATTVFTVANRIEPYDPERVHGGWLTRDDLQKVAAQLCSLSLEARLQLRGLQPRRADVIPAGSLILLAAIEALQATGTRVSDRGLRWGLLAHRFGGGTR